MSPITLEWADQIWLGASLVLMLISAYCAGDLASHKRHIDFLEDQIDWLKATFDEADDLPEPATTEPDAA